MTAVARLVAVGGSCCCCFSSKNLKQMLHGIYVDGKHETYSQMFTSCFKMEFVTTDIETEYDYLICQKCIDHLRLSYSFLIKVVKSQAYLQNEIVHTEVTQMKTDVKLDEIESSRSSFTNVPLDDEIYIKEETNVYNYQETDNNESNLEYNNIDDELNNLSSDKNSDLIDDTYFNGQPDLNANAIINKKSDSNLPEMEKEQFEVNKTDLTCKICNETFLYNKHLVAHMSVHFPNFICHICAKAFTAYRSLKLHVRTTHASLEYICKICDKKFKCNEYLISHMKCHKYPNGINKCPQCPERFRRHHQKIMHLFKVHGEEPKKHKCKLCPKQYFTAGVLSSHLRNVHLHERNYVCLECGAEFFQNTALKNHMLKHTKSKNFQCDICHKSYGRKFTLTEHMKIHYNIKKFVCQVCSKSFTQKCSLKGHMKRGLCAAVHPNSKAKDDD